MTEYVLYACFLLGIGRQVLSFCSMARTAKFLGAAVIHPVTESAEETSSISFVIAIPVLREQSIIEDTICYFSQFAEANHAVLVFITSARETGNQPRSQRSTAEIIEELKETYPGVVHLQCPDPFAVKGDQLNYFVGVIAETLPGLDPRRTLVVIYDADSRPDRGSLRAFREAIRVRPAANVLQQSSLFRCPRGPEA